MTTAGELLVGVTADISKAQRQIETGLAATGAAAGTQVSKTFGGTLAAGLRKAAVPAAVALGGLALAGNAAVKSAEEQIAADRKLAQVFKSMGYTENAAAAKAYAEELQGIIGVDAAEIESAQAKLATFKDVAANQDLLARATLTAANNAAAGFGDMGSQAVGLGKALQDPIKGMNLLSRQGSLTKAEQKAIGDEFLRTGDKAKAQEQILAALEKQTGGVAQASATTSRKMSLAFGEIAEAIGMAAVPIITALLPAVTSFSNWAQNNTPVIIGLVAAIGTIAGAILLANAAMKVWAITQKLIVAAQVAWITVQTALNIALTANPIGLVVVAIAALVAAIVLAWKHSETFRTVVIGAWEGVKRVVMAVVDWFTATVWPALQTVWDGVMSGLRVLRTLFGTVWNAIKTVVTTYLNAIRTVVTTVFNAVRTIVTTIVTVVKNVITTYVKAWLAAFNLLAGIVTKVVSVFTSARDRVSSWMESIRALVVSRVSAVVSQFGAGLNKIVSAVTSAFAAARSAVTTWIANIASRVTSRVGSIVTAFRSIIGRMSEVGRAVVEGIWSGISGAWGWLLGRVRNIVGGILGAAKSALGIGSPSKEAAKQIGRPYVQGKIGRAHV